MEVDLNKLKNMILYFAQNSSVQNLGITKLYKLLYFADVTSMRELGHSMSNSEYIKYEHGPVPSQGDPAIRSLKGDNHISVMRVSIHGMTLYAVRASTRPNTSVFSRSELEILQKISISKDPMTAAQLSEESFLEPAWIHAKMLCEMSKDLMYSGASKYQTVSGVA